tara:strand:- start:4833 stop:5276 length:444 start_codon:yes stop_codon:yes gene_type:complete
MGFLGDRGYVTTKRKVKVATKTTSRGSILKYLDGEIEKAISQNLELKFNPTAKDPKKLIKEIRMWGDVVDGKRRMTLKSMNKKLYDTRNEAIEGDDYHFQKTDVKGVIEEMKSFKKDITNSKEGSLKFWYMKKDNKTGTTNYLEMSI